MRHNGSGGCSSLLRHVCLMSVAAVSVAVFSAVAAFAQGQAATASQTVAMPESASPYRITGVALNGITGEPIPHCRLVVRPAVWMPHGPQSSGAAGASGFSGAEPTSTGEADEQGHFVLRLPRAGHWQLTGTARGFRTQAYEEHDGYFSAVVVSTDAPGIDLNFRLIPDASIEGTVLDEAGEPVRNALVSLLQLPTASPDQRPEAPAQRGNSATDDRGHYEFLSVAPGDYTLSLSAQPWYAAGYREIQRRDKDQGSPLDVVYPMTWFPGVTDFASATPLTIRAGDRRLADFHLLPVTGHRVRIPAAPDESGQHTFGGAQGSSAGLRGGLSDAGGVPWLKALAADGTEQSATVSVNKTAQGQWELSGLAPGTYQVYRRGADARQSSLLEIRPGSDGTVDLATARPPASVAITLEFAGGAPGTPGDTRPPDMGPGSLQVSLISVATGQQTFAQPATRTVRSSPVSQGSAANPTNIDSIAGASTEDTLHLQLVPGRYEVQVTGAGGDLYLTRISGGGAETTGRLVELHSGEAKLVLHLAKGHASVRGVVKRNKLPDAAAMLLLVPATLGEDRSMTVLRRDQSNSDGSFELEDVIPGAYILLAIDHGWMVNWNDPATLRHYLLGGIALDLTKPGDVQRELEAQTP